MGHITSPYKMYISYILYIIHEKLSTLKTSLATASSRTGSPPHPVEKL